MPDINFSEIVNTGIDLPAPNLTYPDDILGSNLLQVVLTTSPALTTALSLTGKWVVNFADFASMTAESTTIKLTVDGDVIWNATFTSGADLNLIGSDTSTRIFSDSMYCNNSFLLEISKATDTSVILNYQARPLK